ncbi:MAG: DUF3159 domain-containing protein, partial [Actinobacteria bacterium]|nr:DUF3159 domain-containing protein [Actinomycetota bacterium]
ADGARQAERVGDQTGGRVGFFLETDDFARDHAVFLARGIVQAVLYHRDATGWLAFARIAMSYPLFILAVGFSFWVVRRARRRLATPVEGVDEPGSAG